MFKESQWSCFAFQEHNNWRRRCRIHREDQRSRQDLFCMLTLMDSKMYALLRTIPASRKPKEISFTETADTLAQHVDPKPTIIPERYKFYKA